MVVLTLFRFLSLFLFLFLSLMVQGNTKQDMHQVYRNSIPSLAYPDKKLKGSTIKAVPSPSLVSCAQECLKLFPRCKSYNYITTSMICELNSIGVSGSLIEQLEQMEPASKTVFTQVLDQTMLFKQCSDHFKYGVTQNGLYYLQDTHHNWYPVYCDFTSEAGKAWTLVLSFSYANHAMPEFFSIPFLDDGSLSEDSPNWEAYRLSKPRMEWLQQVSTHWRVTCDFEVKTIDYRDYLRARMSEMDLLTFYGSPKCGKVEYINVMGHNCTECTALFVQSSSAIFHHDSTKSFSCTFPPTAGSVSSQDNFGLYEYANSNFRCSSTSQATTNYWFGAEI
ncbi:predicted protein [Nematostella vectensis]|uniref:Apple domain-containing protein n=1 Tax=Nematostella vectensis TaxID=45351 RepID=A7T8U0_NEMVE|nr:predicted protein [Nematostella vectensis]|eukprot:XP_001619695.1 hypothetical protein NEMVEDRAFT_v1g248838 [Nematostella vectensis]